MQRIRQILAALVLAAVVVCLCMIGSRMIDQRAKHRIRAEYVSRALDEAVFMSKFHWYQVTESTQTNYLSFSSNGGRPQGGSSDYASGSHPLSDFNLQRNELKTGDRFRFVLRPKAERNRISSAYISGKPPYPHMGCNCFLRVQKLPS